MNVKIKTLLAALLIMLPLVIAAGCSGVVNPYEDNDKAGYNVSVKFDANGGFFTTNTSVIVDSFNVEDMAANSEGKAEIALLSPDNKNRGDNAFNAEKTGYFLAGWYQTRTETGTDAEGNTTYSYSGKWDFENDRVTVAKGEEHSSTEPVMTLYAVWVPVFTVEYYDVGTDNLLGSYSFNPTAAETLNVPAWNTETGAMDMYKFAKKDGYTFSKAFYDKEGTQEVTGDALVHPGTVNPETGVATDPVLKVYVEWQKGTWFKISTAKQLADNARADGNYIISADLDFADVFWPNNFTTAIFTGSIQGNGHTIKNVTFVRNNADKPEAGLFRNIADGATISDLKFENATLTIVKGPRTAGTRIGLFAGTISSSAVITNVEILSGKIEIDPACSFLTDEYAIGLVCGNGTDLISYENITCVEVEKKNEDDTVKPLKFTITVENGNVTVEEAVSEDD